jgi:hypothetical protein
VEASDDAYLRLEECVQAPAANADFEDGGTIGSIDKPSDFVLYDDIFNLGGLEKKEHRTGWLACNNATDTAACQQNAIAEVLKVDVKTLQALAQIQKV